MKAQARPDLHNEIAEALRQQTPIRKDLPGGGRLHLDRPLPFLFLHIAKPGKDEIVAQAATRANAAYAIGSNSPALRDAIKLVVEAALHQFGFALIVSFSELAQPEAPDDDPTLLPLEVHIEPSAGAMRAAEAFKAAILANSEVRLPKVELFPAAGSSLDGLEEMGSCHHLTVRIRPIYREPSSGAIYPDVRERLVAFLFDAGLQACAAMFKPGSIKSHRSLGRKAFVEAVKRVDRSLDEIASSFDVLLAVTPINAEQAFERFVAGGLNEAPEFLYRPLTIRVEDAKQKLHAIAFDQMEDPVLYGLYREKQREMDLQLSLVAARERRTFVELGRALYGPVEPTLLIAAEQILESLGAEGVQPGVAEAPVAEASFVEDRAELMVAAYRAIYPDFAAEIDLRDDLPSGLLVSRDRLLISRSTRMDRRRVEPLLAHEVGVHLLTYFNGSAQGLNIFRSGLSGYEGMQEGLAVFAEYLAGGMTSDRLRLIAARVIACDAMLKGAAFGEVFHIMLDRCGLAADVAFNTTVRVYRGGGFPKDAIYLRGLLELLDHLKRDGTLAPFWMGKIAASHFSVMEELASRGLLRGVSVEPLFLGTSTGKERLERARRGLKPVEMVQTKES